MKQVNKTQSIMLTVLMAFFLMPIAASAQSSGATIDLSDEVTTTGDGWTYAANVFTIDGTFPVTITGTTTTSSVVVSGNANITLNNACIDLRSINYSATAINLLSYTVTLTLLGDNILWGRGSYGTIRTTGDLTFSENSTGTLYQNKTSYNTDALYRQRRGY